VLAGAGHPSLAGRTDALFQAISGHTATRRIGSHVLTSD